MSGYEQQEMKFCSYCGSEILRAAVFCPHCGCQVGEIQTTEPPQIVIEPPHPSYVPVMPVYGGRLKNKWTAFLLCFFFGYFGVHKFYEGRIGLGILYFFTVGLFGFGWLIDCILLLCKPNPYLVR